MTFNWTGISIDTRTGKSRRTGFEITLWGLRFTTFPVPTGVFGKNRRRFILELGPLHAMITWNSHR